VGGTGAVEK
jgi:replication factor C subunit 1